MFNVFDCKKSSQVSSCYVGEEIRQLADLDRYAVSYGQSLESTVDEQKPVELFGLEFFYLDEELLGRLVGVARERIAKLAGDDLRTGQMEGGRVRAEVNRLFRIIVGQVGELEEGEVLKSVEVVEGCLPSLGDAGERLSQGGHEYFHSQLDWRWFGLVVNFLVRRSGSGKDRYGELRRSLLEGLIVLALMRHSRMVKQEVVDQDPFHCHCVQRLWIALMVMSSDDFWDSLENGLKIVQDNFDTGKLKILGGRITSRPKDSVFRIWLLNGIVSLYQYRILDESSFKETPLITLQPDYTILESALKDIAQGSTPEDQVRIALLLLKPIYSKWWPTKQEHLITLWEYFNKRLHLPFQLPSESLKNLACITRSPAGFIEQARELASQQTFDTLDPQTTSFNCYISLIAFTLRHYSHLKQKTKVQILFNRTILRIAPPKLESMPEQAIYNFSLLMLIMLESTPYQDDYLRLSKQLLQFQLDPPKSTTATDALIRRVSTVTLANMAMTVALSEKGFDRSAHLQLFMLDLEKMSRKYGERIQPALQIVAEGMGAVYEGALGRGRFDKGEQSFLGAGWLGRYLKACSESDREALLKGKEFWFLRTVLSNEYCT